MLRTMIGVAVVSVWMVSPASAQDAAAGAQVYAAQKCSVCHAIDGKGNAKGPLNGVGAKLSTQEIHDWIVNPAEMTKKTNALRKPPMRAYPKLPKADLDNLVAYIASLKK